MRRSEFGTGDEATHPQPAGGPCRRINLNPEPSVAHEWPRMDTGEVTAPGRSRVRFDRWFVRGSLVDRLDAPGPGDLLLDARAALVPHVPGAADAGLERAGRPHVGVPGPADVNVGRSPLQLLR